eukprot:CAMPEP_0197671438 /NCGR_PEP_ID=MMETSP1338-20131121/76706_1 /TAXON_ID=43686 ORGANISM="Pelagodinium beii, Strain RCC1491" /NCGR_SAMPLE_ID=MMETSP1338 /ASSEMBLY_ACC=CAM_ASM_000754 /LENGTH=70 /DNA_ID=CAMNT_0043251341 /DNA_START=25 /DNA_END=233 /DNA_ORIENTATION=+
MTVFQALLSVFDLLHTGMSPQSMQRFDLLRVQQTGHENEAFPPTWSFKKLVGQRWCQLSLQPLEDSEFQA